MKDYNLMSDFEINKKIAQIVGLNIKALQVDADDNFEFVIVGRKLTKEKVVYDPCNSWADAGPIIAEHGIGVAPYKRSNAYAWDSSKGMAYGINFEDENPLRAAMIVFLMMRDAGK